MDTNNLAAWLLTFMPFTIGAKTLAAGASAWMLTRQRSEYDYGRYATWFFWALCITSAGLTGLFGRLAWVFHDADRLGPWLGWLLIVELASTATAVLGWLMVRAEKTLP